MRIFIISLLSASLMVLCGFSSCEPQLQGLLPTETNTPADMVLIPAGDTTIGAPQGTVRPDVIEWGIVRPEQTIFVDAFYIDTHEVTVAEFQAFVDAVGYENVSQFSWNWYDGSTPQHPVFASYEAAQAYAKWAGKRLPTDAEWEKAARGGLTGKKYPWGDEVPTLSHAHITPSGTSRGNKPYTVKVGSYAPNGYGLYDMAGNVAEWVYAEEDQEKAFTRGGSWFLTEWYTQVYMREKLYKDGHYTSTGFRCVKDIN